MNTALVPHMLHCVRKILDEWQDYWSNDLHMMPDKRALFPPYEFTPGITELQVRIPQFSKDNTARLHIDGHFHEESVLCSLVEAPDSKYGFTTMVLRLFYIFPNIGRPWDFQDRYMTIRIHVSKSGYLKAVYVSDEGACINMFTNEHFRSIIQAATQACKTTT